MLKGLFQPWPEDFSIAQKNAKIYKGLIQKAKCQQFFFHGHMHRFQRTLSIMGKGLFFSIAKLHFIISKGSDRN